MRVSLIALVPFLLASLLATLPATATQSDQIGRNFEVSVVTSGETESGTSHDGMRIYFLPWETSTVNPPDLAICIFQISNDAPTCSPLLDYRKKPISRCPDNSKCNFFLELSVEYPLVLSFFDLDAFGSDALDSLANAITNIEEYASSNTIFGRRLRKLNKRRWSWIESATLLELGKPAVFADIEALETKARDFIAEHSPPNWLTDIRDGRLSGPFERVPLDNCVEPGPGCQLTYLTFSIKSAEGFIDE